jgi:hypothetical protein
MSGINDLIERRLKAERKLIADFLLDKALSFPSSLEFLTLTVTLPILAARIQRGEYLTMEKNNDSPS